VGVPVVGIAVGAVVGAAVLMLALVAMTAKSAGTAPPALMNAVTSDDANSSEFSATTLISRIAWAACVSVNPRTRYSTSANESTRRLRSDTVLVLVLASPVLLEFVLDVVWVGMSVGASVATVGAGVATVGDLVGWVGDLVG
jgi:hypothetical protein